MKGYYFPYNPLKYKTNTLLGFHSA